MLQIPPTDNTCVSVGDLQIISKCVLDVIKSTSVFSLTLRELLLNLDSPSLHSFLILNLKLLSHLTGFSYKGKPQ